MSSELTFKDERVNNVFDEASAVNVYSKTVINLGPGCPGPDLLKPVADMMKIAVEHRLNSEENTDYHLFQYGPTVGLWGMRQALAEFLTKQYGDEVKRENLVLTCGASHGLHLLISTMLVPNGIIFVEEYAYMIALNLLREFPNFKIVEVPMTPTGIDVAKLRCIAEKYKMESDWKTSKDKPFWAIYYTVPIFHNPTGIVTAPDKCKILVETARDLDFLIVCDDVYNLLYYGNESHPPARLFSYDKSTDADYNGGHVVSNSTFSKILSPGVRVGWMEVPYRLSIKFRQCGLMQCGGSVNNVMFGIVQSILELNLLDEYLLHLKITYKERMTALCTSLRENLPKGCSFLSPSGGYFVWIELPVDTSKFLEWCSERGGPIAMASIRFNYSAITSVPDIQYKKSRTKAVRLSVAFHGAETLRKAAQDLANKLNEYISKTVSGN